MQTTATAFAFMTRLPVPALQPRDGDLTRASLMFPLVGLVVATLGTVTRALVEPLWGAETGTVAGVLAAVLATGAFHEDGLGDTADGLWAAWDVDRRLEVMRDSRLGTYGTIALIGLFALRFALLAPVSLGTFASAMVGGHVVGRASVLVLVRLAPAVAGSSSAAIAGPLSPSGVVVAGGLTVVPVVVAAGVAAGPLLLVAVAVTVAAARMFRRRLGGVTGDTLGATTVIVEVCAMATVIAWQGRFG